MNVLLNCSAPLREDYTCAIRTVCDNATIEYIDIHSFDDFRRESDVLALRNEYCITSTDEHTYVLAAAYRAVTVISDISVKSVRRYAVTELIGGTRADGSSVEAENIRSFVLRAEQVMRNALELSRKLRIRTLCLVSKTRIGGMWARLMSEMLFEYGAADTLITADVNTPLQGELVVIVDPVISAEFLGNQHVCNTFVTGYNLGGICIAREATDVESGLLFLSDKESDYCD